MIAVIGIDPGLDGAIALMTRGAVLVRVEDIPSVMRGKGGGWAKRQADAAGIARLLRDMAYGIADEVLVVMERVSSMPSQGVSSVYSLGDTVGCLRGVAAALGYPLEYVTPAAWKRSYGIASDKEEARTRAIDLYPAAPLGRKKDHNRAEAILIARYGWEHLV